MRTNFRLHDGVRICHLDFSHIPTEEQALEAIAEAKGVIAKEPLASVYTITNVTGSRVTNNLRNALYDLTQHNKPYVLFGAVVGVTAIQRVILRAIIQLTGRKLHAAETMADAVSAVVKEAKGAGR